MEERYKTLCEKLYFRLNTFEGNLRITEYDLIPFLVSAEADLCIYLRAQKPLGKEFEHKILELAEIRILKANAEGGNVKSMTYTEGSVSKSETYLTADDFEKREKELFASLNTYRRCRIVEF